MGREARLVRSLGSLRSSDAGIAGGKGANLGELMAAGFPVPDGFVLTTDAYRLTARSTAADEAGPSEAVRRLRTSEVPPEIADAVGAAYRSLGEGPVAVRSSATAEDLPDASFAGQQDTILDVTGNDDLLDAIRRCWASLWNERAVAYRHANDVDEVDLALAVVVQRMVDAAAAGVMFTADPVTGRRGRVVIEAAPGLGEAVVSGRVNPDRYVIDPGSSAIAEGRITGERPVVDVAIVQELARLGRRVEAHFGFPQDIEFAQDRGSALWLVQSRPITTLYPLPTGVPDAGADPRVYLSVNVAQGYFEPFTPMGIHAFQLLASPADVRNGTAHANLRPPMLVEAGGRLYADLTSAFRNRIGRAVLLRLMGAGEARSGRVLAALASDPRFRVRRGSPSGSDLGVEALGRGSVLRRVVRLLEKPDATRRRLLLDVERLARLDLPPSPTAADRLDATERLFRTVPQRLFPRLIPLVLAGHLPWLAARWVLGSRASDEELQTVVRAAPHNPTTEMDLALWRLAVEVRDDPLSREAVATRPASDLARAYHAGTLPRPLQRGLSNFLDRYGFRAIGEIDLGVPRWSEDPTHIIGAVSNYLRLGDDALAPDRQFARGEREAEAMVGRLLARVRGPRRALLRFLLGRVRALVGTREEPKFEMVRLILSRGRELLRPVGDELAAAGRLATTEDIYFLTLPEVRRGLAGEDFREQVATRRAAYARERARRHIPRILLSDGTDAEVALLPAPEGGLRGSAASPGTVTAPARVVRSPQGVQLEPGEILVAPSTDPGWTPLFLTAGGLVMEMGGMMSHGAVVAREYGIPAVVGVADATERIATGDRVTVDGSAGAVSLETLARTTAGDLR